MYERRADASKRSMGDRPSDPRTSGRPPIVESARRHRGSSRGRRGVLTLLSVHTPKLGCVCFQTTADTGVVRLYFYADDRSYHHNTGEVKYPTTSNNHSWSLDYVILGYTLS